MKPDLKSIAVAAGAAAALLMAVLVFWLLSWKGTTGLIEWSAKWRDIFLVLIILGALPLLLSAAGLVMHRSGDRVRFLPPIALVLSVVSVLCAVGLFVSLRAMARPAGDVPVLHLVDPGAGVRGTEGEVRLSISSDPHWGSSKIDVPAREAVLKNVAAAQPRRDAFFILGDNVDYGMMAASWREEAGDIARLLPGVPVRPLLGNHDALMGGQDLFRRYFFPASLRTDSGSPYWWSMEAGPARIVALDLLWGTDSFSAAQAAWLEKTLSAVPKGEQVVVLSHCFFYASGYVDPDGNMPWYDHFQTIDRISPILERHRVDLVVSGHNHFMELLEHGGVTYAVVGAMGSAPDPERTHVSPASLWYRRGTSGWLDLDIGAGGIRLTFRDKDGAALREALLPPRR